MRVVYGDTSFFLAFVDVNDDLHTKAQSAWKGLKTPFKIYTSELVLVELLNMACGPRRFDLRDFCINYVEKLRASDEVEIVPINGSRMRLAFDFYSGTATSYGH